MFSSTVVMSKLASNNPAGMVTVAGTVNVSVSLDDKLTTVSVVDGVEMLATPVVDGSDSLRDIASMETFSVPVSRSNTVNANESPPRSLVPVIATV